MASTTDKADPRVFACGDDLIGVRLEGTRQCQALADYLRESGEWIESVAGISSCVARFDSASLGISEAIRKMAEAVDSAPVPEESEGEEVEVPVCYGGTCGPDLGNLGEQLGLTSDEIIEMHSGRVWVFRPHAGAGRGCYAQGFAGYSCGAQTGRWRRC